MVSKFFLLLSLLLWPVARSSGSCNDNPNYTWTTNFNGVSYTHGCSYLTNSPRSEENARRQRLNCNRAGRNGVLVRNRCRNSCDNCPSDNPPSRPPQCRDNPNFTWTYDFEGTRYTQSCSFLTNNPRRQQNHCNRVGRNGFLVRDRCRVSCNNCQCRDDPNYTWTYDFDGIRYTQSCSFLTNNPRRQQNHCNRVGRNGVLVRNRCLVSCNNCPSDIPPPRPPQSCRDDPNFTWTSNFDGEFHTYGCSFLTNSPRPQENLRRQQNHCFRRDGRNGSFVRDRCRMACNNCRNDVMVE